MKEKPIHIPGRITYLVCVDDSDECRVAIRLAALRAHRTGGQIVLLYVIEPAAGATRGLLVYLIDAYHEESVKDAKGNDTTRVVMKLHPRLAPFKVL